MSSITNPKGLAALDIAREPSVSVLSNEVSQNKIKVLSSSIFKDLLKGVISSRVFRAMVLTAGSTAALFTILSNPVGWLVATVAVGAFITSLVAQTILDKGSHKISLEPMAIIRLLKSKDYNEIIEVNGHKLYLGSMPNRLNKLAEKLSKDKHLTILSVNEDWEREPLGLSIPYRKKDYAELEVTFEEFDAPDHSFLTDANLDKAAEIIERNLKLGNVYVHCRAGKGRSAQAIAAYLIKHKNMTAEEAVQTIEEHRPISTVRKKLENEDKTLGLKKYYYDTQIQQTREDLRKIDPEELDNQWLV